ncbi:F0F1 ATP synthase subunit B [Paraliobacillus quinghaiensis]|uniref:F0F1 ATP synthase subunit B n=1 Tax=Paraliobacillus quinghaiensis TaxID=470815 RepID=UPI000E3EB440|nr:F0F1 ATP synthase subunit B [Paraliobacillus quinghaiensis]
MQDLTGNLILGAAAGGLHIGDIIFSLLSFAVLLYLLKRFAWAPLLSKMEERENYIANELDVAEKNRVAAEKASQEANDRLKQTRQEAQGIIEDAKKAGAEQEQSIIKAAESAAERIKQSAQEEIKQEKENAIQALQEQVASLSVQIATKVIEKEINAQDQEKLISDYMKEIGEE